MQSIARSSAPRTGARRCSAPLLLMLLLGAGLPASAQSESYLLGPGSNVGPATKVQESDCVTKPDGSVTCNTKLVNPSGDTKAKPVFSPLKN